MGVDSPPEIPTVYFHHLLPFLAIPLTLKPAAGHTVRPLMPVTYFIPVAGQGTPCRGRMVAEAGGRQEVQGAVHPHQQTLRVSMNIMAPRRGEHPHVQLRAQGAVRLMGGFYAYQCSSQRALLRRGKCRFALLPSIVLTAKFVLTPIVSSSSRGSSMSAVRPPLTQAGCSESPWTHYSER